MTDIHDREIRRFNMSMIKGKDTKPEILVRKFLFQNGFRYRLNSSMLPGKPDIVLPKYKTVLFVNGCFWHGHEGCKYFIVPKTRTEWWINKINKTKERDKTKANRLKELGWKILVIWECELKPKNVEESLINLLSKLKDKN